jgi:Ribosomal silencing factor during starvation
LETGAVQGEAEPLVEWSAFPETKPADNSRKEAPTKKDLSGNANSSLPWYLRHQSSRKKLDDDHPFAERQKLPDLPPDPPPILQGIFEYASVDLGLDNLSLLDLRKLDPPAALGANLVMVIGSARSEKHLHVSADRFCRWLRSKHKLTPYADGLLGRNELKLKLRRKNRRSKMLATVGTVERADLDDGISTGWICVQAGQVEPAKTAIEEEIVEQNFVGFGEHSHRVTVVVQMFTEEKRADTDLESLWNGILERNSRKQKHREAAERGDVEDYLDDVKPDSDKLRQAHLSGRIPLTPLHTTDESGEEHIHR